MLKLRIAHRFWLGFGLVLALLLVVAGVTLVTQRQQLALSAEVGAMVDDSAVGARARADMLSMRTNASEFLVSSDPAEAERFDEWRVAFEKEMASAREFRNPKRLAMVDEVADKFERYLAAFEQAQQAIAARNVLRDERLAPLGGKIRRETRDATLAAAEANLVEPTRRLGETLMYFMLSRFYANAYLESGTLEDYERTVTEFDRTADELDEVIALVDDPALLGALESIKADVKSYRNAMDEAKALRVQRDRFVVDQMDVLGPEIADLWARINDSLQEDSAAMTARAESLVGRSIAITLTLTLVALALGFVAALILSRSIVRPVNVLKDEVSRVAENLDLTRRVPIRGHDELADMGKSLNGLLDTLHEVVSATAAATNDVAAAATQISASSEELSQGSREQADQVTQISAAVEELAASVVEVARKAADASTNAERSGQVAGEGGQIVEQTVTGMESIRDAVTQGAQSVNELGKRGEQIGAVIQVINDIADQTNLLALNAAIEAARAGEHGRGFAVVADEVRKLADRTVKATEEIAESIQAVQNETGQAVSRMDSGTQRVTEGVDLANQAGGSLRQIVGNVAELGTMIQQIAAAAEEQSAASEEISQKMQSIDGITAQSNEAAQQTATAGAQLSSQAESLRAMVGRFRVKGQAAEPAAA